MRPKTLSTQGTKVPFDYDLNNKSGYTEWRKYIRKELTNSILPTEMVVVDAKKILNENPQPRIPLTREENIKGDRIMYGMIVLTVIVLAIILSV